MRKIWIQILFASILSYIQHIPKAHCQNELKFTLIAMCKDALGWYDIEGDNCEWYSQIANACRRHGDDYINFGKTANIACCICGGGYYDPPKAEPSPTMIPSRKPIGVKTFTPQLSASTASPSLLPSALLLPSTPQLTSPPMSPVRSPSQTSVTCQDDYDWYDIDGISFNCEWYSEERACENHGHNHRNFGKTANDACCACGGGDRVDNYYHLPTVSPSTMDPTIGPTQNCEDETVFDKHWFGELVPMNWYDARGPFYNCEWYSSQDDRVCMFIDEDLANFDMTAYDACCKCRKLHDEHWSDIDDGYDDHADDDDDDEEGRKGNNTTSFSNDEPNFYWAYFLSSPIIWGPLIGIIFFCALCFCCFKRNNGLIGNGSTSLTSVESQRNVMAGMRGVHHHEQNNWSNSSPSHLGSTPRDNIVASTETDIHVPSSYSISPNVASVFTPADAAPSAPPIPEAIPIIDCTTISPIPYTPHGEK